MTLYETVLERITTLMDQDPERDTPEGKELLHLAEIITAYELATQARDTALERAWTKYQATYPTP